MANFCSCGQEEVLVKKRLSGDTIITVLTCTNVHCWTGCFNMGGHFWKGRGKGFFGSIANLLGISRLICERCGAPGGGDLI